MGSLFKIKFTAVKDFRSFIEAARSCGRRIFAAELSDSSVPLRDAGVCGHDIFIIGNEGHGIPKEISSLCDNSVYIPISEATESLNAAVAASILIWEQSK
jgi:TrmH family RNA methyltransferase